ncbi:MAG: TIGR03643 family protein [Bdellovibrio sp.]|nr:TIGR03643 family protein [Bdellovibrio sp.]
MSTLSAEDMARMIRMGWEDRTTFEAIQAQFNFTENEFVRFMRRQLNVSDFSRWRRRAHEQGQLKHEKKRGFKVTRFKCSRQSVDGITKGWK